MGHDPNTEAGDPGWQPDEAEVEVLTSTLEAAWHDLRRREARRDDVVPILELMHHLRELDAHLRPAAEAKLPPERWKHRAVYRVRWALQKRAGVLAAQGSLSKMALALLPWVLDTIHHEGFVGWEKWRTFADRLGVKPDVVSKAVPKLIAADIIRITGGHRNRLVWSDEQHAVVTGERGPSYTFGLAGFATFAELLSAVEGRNLRNSEGPEVAKAATSEGSEHAKAATSHGPEVAKAATSEGSHCDVSDAEVAKAATSKPVKLPKRAGQGEPVSFSPSEPSEVKGEDGQNSDSAREAVSERPKASSPQSGVNGKGNEGKASPTTSASVVDAQPNVAVAPARQALNGGIVERLNPTPQPPAPFGLFGDDAQIVTVAGVRVELPSVIRQAIASRKAMAKAVTLAETIRAVANQGVPSDAIVGALCNAIAKAPRDTPAEILGKSISFVSALPRFAARDAEARTKAGRVSGEKFLAMVGARSVLYRDAYALADELGDIRDEDVIHAFTVEAEDGKEASFTAVEARLWKAAHLRKRLASVDVAAWRAAHRNLAREPDDEVVRATAVRWEDKLTDAAVKAREAAKAPHAMPVSFVPASGIEWVAWLDRNGKRAVELFRPLGFEVAAIHDLGLLGDGLFTATVRELVALSDALEQPWGRDLAARSDWDRGGCELPIVDALQLWFGDAPRREPASSAATAAA